MGDVIGAVHPHAPPQYRAEEAAHLEWAETGRRKFGSQPRSKAFLPTQGGDVRRGNRAGGIIVLCPSRFGWSFR